MIIDLERFVAAEQHYWSELESQLAGLERDPHRHPDLAAVERLHYLYQRAASDLARLASFSAEAELRRTLGALVARAYAEIHGESGAGGVRLRPFRWLASTFPRTFRRHAGAFWLAVAITLAGSAFGAFALASDPESKEIILPFSQLLGEPSERVAEEEKSRGAELAGRKATFSSTLMTNNIRVAIFALAMGLTWCVGTIVILFYNGVILGAVVFDYLRDGQGVFLCGWLLPHGSIEIPSILVAGQAGLVLGSAMIGWGKRIPLGQRLQAVRADLVTLIAGVGLLLVWAGIVEAFFSQYHAPVLPYSVKITFGCLELAALALFLARSGRRDDLISRP